MQHTRSYPFLVLASLLFFLSLSFGGSLAQGNGVKITQVTVQAPLSAGQTLIRGNYQAEGEEPGMRIAANVFINNSLTGSTVVNGGKFEITLPGGRKLAAGEQVYVQLVAAGGGAPVEGKSDSVTVQTLR